MPCLLAILLLAFPRVALVLLFFLSNYLQRAYQGLLVLLLGFIFLPLTTLVYAWIVNNGGSFLVYGAAKTPWTTLSVPSTVGPGSPGTFAVADTTGWNVGDTITIEPWRAKAFPVIRDLVTDRSAFDRVIAAGGFITSPTGSAPDGNAILVSKGAADAAMDAAACIGCGACVAACPSRWQICVKKVRLAPMRRASSRARATWKCVACGSWRSASKTNTSRFRNLG